MSWFKQFTVYQPCQTATTSTTWIGWQIVNPRCYGCVHSCVMCGKLVCHCASRTMMHGPYGDTCTSYFGRR